MSAVLYLHGFASSPASAKIGLLRARVEPEIVLYTPDLNVPSFERLDFDDNQILNGRLSAYRVPRFSDIPEMDVILIDNRNAVSSGAGESPITASAPSIGSAIFAATGKRIRSLPMLPALADGRA